MESSFAHRNASRDPLIGRVLQDRYRVEKRIGKGGMGIVYLAEHVLLRRKVALKTLSERAFASEELIARFHREATAAAAIGNDHVVGVTDMGQLEDGSYYVVLEYLDGCELGYAVGSQGPFSVPRAAGVIRQLCDALTAVHARGIVHRDLKPENLFLVERNGEPDFLKVLDFGVCKVHDAEHPGEAPLTRTGASLGTPQYMAPEQIENSATVDARTDIYAAGAILFFALTGHPPFEDTTLPRLLMRICSEPPPALRSSRPELPSSLEAVIARAMAREPGDRFQSSEELRAALEPFAAMTEDVSIASRVSGVVPASTFTPSMLGVLPKRRRFSRRSVAIAMVAALALALLFTLALRAPNVPAVAHQEATSTAPTASTLKLDLAPALEPEPAPTTAAAAPAPTLAKPRKRIEPIAAAPVAPAAQPIAPQPAPIETPSEPAPEPAPAVPSSKYRLSQRELKDVFP